MALPVVRTRDEAHLYMDLHPCERCGSVEVAWESGLTDDGGEPARRYSGVCGGCQAPREFVFRLPERPSIPGPDDAVFFGGPEHSQLLDPGEWRLIADLGIQDGSSPLSGDPAVDAERKRSFVLAVAAFGEVLKFIPEGGDAVPESSFWTPHGRAAYEENPALFRREQLERSRRNFADELEDRFRDL
ncbi:hypothetical protein [Phytohabitans kaempferiae]|uniref:Uncharacterized protein n=1 Tax=Phytohabitans kaempferiae TaxID=1620943 RepID=A0ABV6M8L2_9ACTN